MKVLLIAFLAIATVSADQVCTPGSFFRTNCNNCICSQDGTTYMCSQRKCSSGFFNEDGSMKSHIDIIQKIIPDATEIEIIPAETIESADILQKINENGRIEVVPSQVTEIGKITYEQICTPHSFFQINCNHCQCSGLGTKYHCSPMSSCPNTVYNPARHPVQEKKCKPGKKFKEYCNDCICSKDGTDYSCTSKTCDTTVYEKDGSFKIPYKCEPNSRYQQYCNQCTCMESGLLGICTAIGCVGDTFYEDGTLRYPTAPLYRNGNPCRAGEFFYSSCNQCICRQDGRSAYCTQKNC